MKRSGDAEEPAELIEALPPFTLDCWGLFAAVLCLVRCGEYLSLRGGSSLRCLVPLGVANDVFDAHVLNVLR